MFNKFPLLSAFILAWMIGGVVVAIYWIGRRLFILVADRHYVRQHPEEALREAERFYYLALWAALNGKPAFGRKMLTQARRQGFSDTARLQDPTLTSITG